jgi:hypothetical protein
MSEREKPVVLDLPRLHAEVELSRPVAQAIALAASVVLDRLHGAKESHPAKLHEASGPRLAELRRSPVDDLARNSYGDPQEATEKGGEAVAIALAKTVLERIVFRRLPKGTGADYLMRNPLSLRTDEYERLECSAIGDGQEETTARLRSKLNQLARYPDQPPGWAVVTCFRVEPIEIRFERESR